MQNIRIMKLKIKNFGPLTKGGTIDLDKRFYVFVGKNGSGKTYLANLMYEMFGYDYYKLVSKIIKENKPYFEFDSNQSLELKKEALTILNEVSHDLLKSIFGTSNPSLLEKSNLVFFHYETFFEQELQENYSKFYSDDDFIRLLFCKEKNSNRVTWSIDRENTSNNYNEAELSKDMIDAVFMDILSQMLLHNRSYGFLGSKNIFLPASRTSLLSLWKYIARTERKEKDILFDINSNGKLLSKNELKTFQSLYTKPVKELIDQIESFDAQSSEPKNNYPDLVQELEELMGGKIKVHEPKEGIGRKRFTFEMAENGQELELFLASSAVNQLSILYIYLKYWAGERGNFLMIDEPEINLHPENQIKLVNLLMKFADRNDNRVLITTHSTLLTDIINNHVRIGYLQTKGEENTEWLKNHQLDINENITYKDFGVYHFTGNAIEEYPVGEYGVAFKDFNKVIKEVEGLEDELKDQIYNSLRQEEN